jgi:hypothetical protein
MAKRKETDNTMAKRKETDNTMAKRKETDNTMAKRKRTDNTMAKRKETDNTMAKRKRNKGTNNDLQNTTQKKQRSNKTNPTKNWGELRCSGRVNSSCFTSIPPDNQNTRLIRTNRVVSLDFSQTRFYQV